MSKFTPITIVGRRIVELRQQIIRYKDEWTKSRQIILKFFEETTIPSEELNKKSNKELLEILWKDFEDSNTVENIEETPKKYQTIDDPEIIL